MAESTLPHITERKTADRLNFAVARSFLVHSGSELAVSVVRRIAAGHSEGFSPLLLIGATGAGKSRILAHLVEETNRVRPEAVVSKTDGPTIRQWVNEVRKPDAAHAIRRSGERTPFRFEPDEESQVAEWAELRMILRHADLVIVDDLEALAGQFAAQTELESTIESYVYSGGCLVLAAKSVPLPDGSWNPRLLSLLGGGLVLRVELPDESAKRRFVMEWSAAAGAPLPVDVIDRIVAAATDFGTLKGRLERLRLSASVHGVTIAEQLDREERSAEMPEGPPREAPTPQAITRLAAKEFGVKAAEIRGADRHPGLVLPRHVAIWLCDKHAGISRNRIGAYFSGRDSATVRHAIRKIDAMRLNDREFDARLTRLEASLAARSD